MIGIDPDKRLFYEGSSNYGHGLWPSPTVTVASIVNKEADLKDIHPSNDLGFAKLVFREDSFDPVTRIRRGRFYANPGTQPQEWHVQQHPAYAFENGQSPTGIVIKWMYGFRPWPASAYIDLTVSQIALGIKDVYTIWRPLTIERIVTGDDLVTLLARSSFGTVSELDARKVPEPERQRTVESYKALVDTALRAGPESVIDRSRDLVQVLLAGFLKHSLADEPGSREDLSGQVKRLHQNENSKQRHVLLGAAGVVARLHARAKPNVRDELNLRPITEEDATFALQCASAVIRELNYIY